MPHAPLFPGEPAPFFRAATRGNPRFAFDTVAGRWIVLAFPAPGGEAALHDALAAEAAFDDDHACAFLVAPHADPGGRLAGRIPGLRVFLDADRAVARLYGVAAEGAADRPALVLIDPEMRVEAIVPVDRLADLAARLRRLPPAGAHAGAALGAPVLLLRNVLEPALCRRLIDLYEDHGGQESGFMREIDGRTHAVMDPSHKVRRDAPIDDPGLRATLQSRIARRVVPAIAKAHQFHATRMERYIVSCYDAAEGAHFNAHRDNTTSGTAHRRFAVSINLNDGFAGGEVSFPEYGPRGLKAPAGGAVVFSCSLLHRVSKVTEGRRYAFLPFLYDDAAARVRAANLGRLAPAG
ncbi:2OG-Fe(II) oxygenase [Jannaschia sp. Os4]|uniref:2OG-Fe(II) oxygenase n=1 Tax=Jannaschia sp. Os4 TaxID=2807617 RepID=UPI0019397FD4|nr:2OG-Fe(II) oxygenase [Jannaschia sp. Os4]MBM2577744.1 2OG-Fe(II) oxygenase [Jannaschia sp. Os4]